MPLPCSERTSAQGEPLAGTAGAVDALLAVAWPKPAWDPEDAERSEGLPLGLRALVEQGGRGGRKVAVRLFQRAPRPATDRVELIGLLPREGRSVHLRDVSIESLVERISEFLAGETAPPLEEPLALVCTDGRHDRCCARAGRPVYAAFRREGARRRLGLAVAESSHLGGHRFAATCLLLPSGEMYGRLGPQDVPALLDAIATGSVWVPRFRGRLGATEPAQVAEAYVRGLHPRVHDLRLEVAEVDEGRARVHARCAGLDLELECRARSFRAPTRCGETEATEARARWVVTAARDRHEERRPGRDPSGIRPGGGGAREA